MNKPLWVQELTYDQLAEMLNFIEDAEIKGITDSSTLLLTMNTWYDHLLKEQQLVNLSIDIRKEAADRWLDLFSSNIF